MLSNLQVDALTTKLSENSELFVTFILYDHKTSTI